MKFFKIKINIFFVVDYDLIYGINCLALPMNTWTLCVKCFLYVNSVLGLCLHLIDIALNINLPFDMCRWRVEREDVGVVHEVLAKHHQCLTSRLLLRL